MKRSAMSRNFERLKQEEGSQWKRIKGCKTMKFTSRGHGCLQKATESINQMISKALETLSGLEIKEIIQCVDKYSKVLGNVDM